MLKKPLFYNFVDNGHLLDKIIIRTEGKTSTDILERYYLGEKYKPVILYCLMEFEIVRFNELKRYLKTVSDKTLSVNLKELEADDLIIRKEYPQIPPKVEYSLSERGKSLMEVLDKLCIWGEENKRVVTRSQNLSVL